MEAKDQIKERIDIVEFVGEYLELKPAGGGSFKAVCPFHAEKTPSFYASKEKQIWHCFGCGEGGDCFSFLMKMEGMDFSEALSHLGKKVGIEVKRFSSTKSNEKQRMMAINELAAKFYQKVLLDSTQAVAARSYLENRGINSDLIERFGIGFALDSWDTLANFLSKKGYSGGEGLKAGLLLKSKKGHGMIDRFRGRIMIPLRDRHGNTVGFTGRILSKDAQGPKYMNSPETPVYHKSEILYGLDVAKRAIKEQGRVIVVEGNLDVVASHKAGVENVVASSGTALTEHQLNLLKRYTETLIFSFDSDAAGFAAAQRGMGMAKELGLDVRVAVLPAEVKDPDEAVQKDPELWKNAVSKTVPVMQYFIDNAIQDRDLTDVDDKKQVAKVLLPELARIPDVVEREHWLQIIADLLRTDIVVLRKSIEITKNRPQQSQKDSAVQVKQVKKQSKEEQAAYLLIALFIGNEDYRDKILELIDETHLPSVELKKLYKEMTLSYHQSQSDIHGQKSLFQQVRDRVHEQFGEGEITNLLDQIGLEGERILENIPLSKVLGYIEQLAQILVSSSVDKRRKSLDADIRSAEQRGDIDTVKKLIREYNELR